MTLAVTAILASIAPSGFAGPAIDLALRDLRLQEVSAFEDHIRIEFSYRVENVGDVDVDLNGPLSPFENDNVGIQTYLATDEGGLELVVAAAGGVIIDPIVLAPGESYSGLFVSNTIHTPTPGDLGAFQWLLVETFNTFGDVDLSNNRGVLLVPTPAPVAMLAMGGVVMVGRRRSR